MTPRPPLLTFRFVAICLFMLLAYCNIAVFYNLYPYLESIGVPQPWRGPIISVSSLATIAGFLVFTPRLTVKNAPWAIYAGIVLLTSCGVGYLFLTSIPGLFLLRVVNGVAIALLTGSATTLLVAHIAPERSGQAFGVYSLAGLTPYSVVPALYDHLGWLFPTAAHGYAFMALTLIPAAFVNYLLQRQEGGHSRSPQNAAPPAGVQVMLTSMRTPQTALMLIINTVYYLNFSALFFLSKSLFAHRGLGGVGLFFTIQTALMILIRLFASRLFDEVRKTLLVVWCYALTTIGYALLFGTYGLGLEVASALVLGLGMGVGPPALNALMYEVSEPRVKAVNSNLMVMALQAGNFMGPILGGLAVGMLGYSGFLAVGALACLGGMALVWWFIRAGYANGHFS
jgi:MFS family permease